MSPKTSRMMAEEEDTRGSSGCFGWFFKLFRRKHKSGHKHKDAEPSETPVESDPNMMEKIDDKSGNVPSIYLQNNRVTEINEGNVSEENSLTKACSAADAAEDVGEEQKGLDGFVPCEKSASPDNEATAAAATTTRMSACQRRKARRRALGAAMKASAASETAANLEESRASTENEEVATAESSDNVTEAHSGTSATKRRRARRKALAAKIKSEDRLARVRTEEPPAPNRTSVWLSPSVRMFGSDGRPFVTTWEKAAYGAFHAQRY